MANEVGNGMMENAKKYYVKEDTDYASKGVGNTALGLSIGALGLELLRNGGLGNILNPSGNSCSNGCNVTCDDRLADMKEYHNEMFQNYKFTRDSIDAVLAKQNQDAFALFQGYTNQVATLQKEIDELKTKNAVAEATRPLQDQLIMNAIALEAERRCCNDNKIVNYMNSNFYPINVADITTATTTTQRTLLNPLCACC